MKISDFERYIMKIDKKAYAAYADRRGKKSPILKDCLKAYACGGGICTFAQLLKNIYSTFTDTKNAAALVSVTLIFITAVLTGIGVFDRIAKHTGAGTLVPITGFANAVASCAVDTKGEGFILGVGAKIFTIAGPVILYGTAAGCVYGVIYYIFTCL